MGYLCIAGLILIFGVVVYKTTAYDKKLDSAKKKLDSRRDYSTRITTR